MLKRTNITLLVVLLFLVPAFSANALAAARSTSSFSFFAVSDKEQDGLAGPVRRVRTETAKLSLKDGKAAEGQRKVLRPHLRHTGEQDDNHTSAAGAR